MVMKEKQVEAPDKMAAQGVRAFSPLSRRLIPPALGDGRRMGATPVAEHDAYFYH